MDAGVRGGSRQHHAIKQRRHVRIRVCVIAWEGVGGLELVAQDVGERAKLQSTEEGVSANNRASPATCGDIPRGQMPHRCCGILNKILSANKTFCLPQRYQPLVVHPTLASYYPQERPPPFDLSHGCQETQKDVGGQRFRGRASENAGGGGNRWANADAVARYQRHTDLRAIRFVRCVGARAPAPPFDGETSLFAARVGLPARSG